VARGPKPAAVLREWNVPIAINVREPNTWREILDATRDRSEKRIAVQEYGRSNPELIEGLRARGAEVIPVRVYRWDLPLDLAPLKEAVRRIAGGQADVVMFTTGTQVAHLFRVAAEAGLEEALRQRLREAVVASIGPTTSEMLEEYGILADIVPGHPRMGFLVKETADRAPAVLAEKRKA
jgi:uroporphyrinogen-III synthase